MRVLTVVGARPQFIKAFPVSRELRRSHEEVLVHTGQHYDEALSEVFFADLDLPRPDYNLGVGSAPHARQTAAMMQRLDRVVETTTPDGVLVYGDTNSTLAASLVAAKRPIDLIHVEAGLRSHNRSMPEEINRVLTDHIADLLFTPTDRALESLAAEGITEGTYNTGDVMYDALQWARTRAAEWSRICEVIGVEDTEFVLTTVHRPRNTDNRERLATILDELAAVPHPVVFPAHPRTVDRLEQYGLLARAEEDFRMRSPVGYLDFVRLLDEAGWVATDSGGVQKEAFLLDTPCITFRDETEWVETVEAGWNVLVDAEPARIREAFRRDFDFDEKPQPYGDGNAAKRVVSLLTAHVTQ